MCAGNHLVQTYFTAHSPGVKQKEASRRRTPATRKPSSRPDTKVRRRSVLGGAGATATMRGLARRHGLRCGIRRTRDSILPQNTTADLTDMAEKTFAGTLMSINSCSTTVARRLLALAELWDKARCRTPARIFSTCTWNENSRCVERTRAMSPEKEFAVIPTKQWML